MNPVNWIEMPVKDMQRAKAFYTTLLGRELKDMPSPGGDMQMATLPMEQNQPNAAGALVKGKDYVPRSDGTTVYFQCDELSKELSRVEPAGGKVLTPKTSIGEYGFIALALDTEGNRIGLHSRK
jgi:predicted enzyme related to lactoylglutathione lyase